MKPSAISNPVGTVRIRSVCTSVVFILILLCTGHVCAWTPPSVLRGSNDVAASDTTVEIEAQVTGDLNGDSKADLVFVVKRPVPGSLTEGFTSAVMADANLSTGAAIYSWTDNYDYPTQPSVFKHAITKKIAIKPEALSMKETIHKKKGLDGSTPTEELITAQNPFWHKLK